MSKKYTSDTQEILEIVRFIKDHAASQESVDRLEKRVEKVEQGLGHVEQRLGEVNYDLKVYIDEKLADYTSDIFNRLDKKYKKDGQFKEKVVELFRKHKIGTPEELAFLKGLVEGSN